MDSPHNKEKKWAKMVKKPPNGRFWPKNPKKPKTFGKNDDFWPKNPVAFFAIFTKPRGTPGDWRKMTQLGSFFRGKTTKNDDFWVLTTKSHFFDHFRPPSNRYIRKMVIFLTP